MTEIELGPRSLRVIGGIIYDAVAHIAKDQCPDWGRVDYAIAELDRTAKPEAPIARMDIWKCTGCGAEFAAESEVNAHIDTCEKHPNHVLRAERDKLALALAGVSEELGLPPMMGPAKGWLKSRLEIADRDRERLIAIDEAAAKLPKMPWEPTTDATAELAEWGTLLRSTAAVLQIRLDRFGIAYRDANDGFDGDHNLKDATQEFLEDMALEYLERMPGKYQHIEKERDLAIKERDALQVRNSELEQQNRVLGGTTCQMSDKIKDLKTERDTLQVRVGELDAQQDMDHGVILDKTDALNAARAESKAASMQTDRYRDRAEIAERDLKAALAEAEGLRRDMETMQAYSYRAGLNDKTGVKLAEIESAARRQGVEEERERIFALLDGGDLCLVLTTPNDCCGSHLTGSSLREALATENKEGM